MDKIKELTDFYMWMQENDYDHNIRARVEKKAEMYLNNINVGQKLPIHNVSGSCFDTDIWGWRYEIQYRLDRLKALGQLDNKQHPYNIQIENRRRYIRDKLKLKYNYL